MFKVPKPDKTKLGKIVQQTEKKYGKGSLFTIGGSGNLEIPRNSTGIAEFDQVIGGGIPFGRIIELYGVESAGKTELAYHIMARYDFAVFIDAEGTFDETRAKLHKNKKGQLVVRRPEDAEETLGLIFELVKAGTPVVVVDSIPALVPRRENEQSSAKFEKTAGVSMLAGLLSRKLPILANLCGKHGTTVIFLNQVREDQKAGPFGDPYRTPGGRALKHNASLRLQIGRKGWLKHPKLGTFGQVCKVRVKKSKVCKPFGECEIGLIFDKGFIPLDELASIRKEIIESDIEDEEEEEGDEG